MKYASPLLAWRLSIGMNITMIIYHFLWKYVAYALHCIWLITLSLEIHLSCLKTSQPKNKILCYLQFFCGANTCTIMHSVKLRTSAYVLCPLRIPKERSKVKEILFSSLILFCLVSIVLLRSFCGLNLCYLNVLNNTTTISNDLLFFSLQFVIMPKAGGLQTAGVLCILGLDVNSGYQKCGDVD